MFLNVLIEIRTVRFPKSSLGNAKYQANARIGSHEKLVHI